MTLIDKVAWPRSRTPAPSNEIEELAWLTYADRARVYVVDQLIFDDLHRSGQLS